jgi:Protein of unknown function (DUF4232)
VRLFFAVIPAIVVLVSLCGSPVPLPGSPTPTASPILTRTVTRVPSAASISPTPGPSLAACNASDLTGAFVGFNAAAATYFLIFGVTNVGASGCELTGPPQLRFLDTYGAAIPMAYATSAPCHRTAPDCVQNGPLCWNANVGCVYDGLIELPPGAPTPHPWPQTQTPAELGQAALTVSMGSDGLYDGCQPLDPQPATIGLLFPGTGEIDIGLAGDEGIQKCWRGVQLENYGPLETDAPTPTPPAALCRMDQLAGTYVSANVALGTEHYQFGITNTSDQECTLASPPQLQLLDATGTDLGMNYLTNFCKGPTRPDCLVGGRIPLSAGGMISFDVAIAGIDEYPPCSPSFQAQSVGLNFGTEGELRIPFGVSVVIQKCYPTPVTLFTFG